MKFGFDQIKKETPLFIKRLQNAINFLLGSSLLSTGVLTKFFHTDAQTFGELLGLILLSSNVLLIMFGVKDEPQPMSLVGGRPDDREPTKKP